MQRSSVFLSRVNLNTANSVRGTSKGDQRYRYVRAQNRKYFNFSENLIGWRLDCVNLCISWIEGLAWRRNILLLLLPLKTCGDWTEKPAVTIFFKNSVISGALDWLIKSPLLLAKRKKIMPVLALRNRKFAALKKQSFYTEIFQPYGFCEQRLISQLDLCSLVLIMLDINTIIQIAGITNVNKRQLYLHWSVARPCFIHWASCPVAGTLNYDIRRPVLSRVSTCSTLAPRAPRVNTVKRTALCIAYFRFHQMVIATPSTILRRRFSPRTRS